MSKTTEIEGIYWWQDNDDIWHIAFDEDLIEEVIGEFGVFGYRELKKEQEEK